MSIALGAGTALSAFGVATPAGAITDCSAGVTVNATEAAIRAAITAGETLICVNPGTIDMSPTGVDSSGEPFVVEGADLTLVALGTVILDGGDDQDHAILSNGFAFESLTIEGFTFTGFHTESDFGTAVVELRDSTGQLTVINSTFVDNVGYAMVGTNESSGRYPTLSVATTVFENNESWYGEVSGKSDVTVIDSTFVQNSGQNEVISWGFEDANTQITGNFFAGNGGGGSVVYTATDTSSVYNNTFYQNLNEDDGGVAMTVSSGQDAVIAFNTFAYNVSDGNANADIRIDADTDVSLLGNMWISNPAGSLESHDNTDPTANYIDEGGNFSTTNESAFLDDPTSESNLTTGAMDIQTPADNGGATRTAALGANSVGIDAVRPSAATALLGFAFDVDQRGDDRVGNIDAGAFEFGELADTGVDATGIALTGGVLGAAGVGLVARRRRKA